MTLLFVSAVQLFLNFCCMTCQQGGDFICHHFLLWDLYVRVYWFVCHWHRECKSLKPPHHHTSSMESAPKLVIWMSNIMTFNWHRQKKSSKLQKGSVNGSSSHRKIMHYWLALSIHEVSANICDARSLESWVSTIAIISSVRHAW